MCKIPVVRGQNTFASIQLSIAFGDSIQVTWSMYLLEILVCAIAYCLGPYSATSVYLS